MFFKISIWGGGFGCAPGGLHTTDECLQIHHLEITPRSLTDCDVTPQKACTLSNTAVRTPNLGGDFY
jgi:hypothetical protein